MKLDTSHLWCFQFHHLNTLTDVLCLRVLKCHKTAYSNTTNKTYISVLLYSIKQHTHSKACCDYIIQRSLCFVQLVAIATPVLQGTLWFSSSLQAIDMPSRSPTPLRHRPWLSWQPWTLPLPGGRESSEVHQWLGKWSGRGWWWACTRAHHMDQGRISYKKGTHGYHMNITHHALHYIGIATAKRKLTFFFQRFFFSIIFYNCVNPLLRICGRV